MSSNGAMLEKGPWPHVDYVIIQVNNNHFDDRVYKEHVLNLSMTTQLNSWMPFHFHTVQVPKDYNLFSRQEALKTNPINTISMWY